MISGIVFTIIGAIVVIFFALLSIGLFKVIKNKEKDEEKIIVAGLGVFSVIVTLAFFGLILTCWGL